jgi:hypothetical protein
LLLAARQLRGQVMVWSDSPTRSSATSARCRRSAGLILA